MCHNQKTKKCLQRAAHINTVLYNDQIVVTRGRRAAQLHFPTYIALSETPKVKTCASGMPDMVMASNRAIITQAIRVTPHDSWMFTPTAEAERAERDCEADKKNDQKNGVLSGHVASTIDATP